jgi:hypothetical protein
MIEYRWAEGRSERYTEIGAEFVRLKVDVITNDRLRPTCSAKYGRHIICVCKSPDTLDPEMAGRSPC